LSGEHLADEREVGAEIDGVCQLDEGLSMQFRGRVSEEMLQGRVAFDDADQ
jgi:hypothetical protein